MRISIATWSSAINLWTKSTVGVITHPEDGDDIHILNLDCCEL
jgi:hypothetical protein